MFRKLWCRIRTHHKLSPATRTYNGKHFIYIAHCQCGHKYESHTRNWPTGLRKNLRQQTRIAKRLGYL